MEPKMSVGLDTSMSIGLTGHPWLPTPSPTLKLPTPTLEAALAVTPTDWSNPLASAPPYTSAAPPGATGFTPRATTTPPPPYGALASPSVSGDISAVVDAPPSTKNATVADLFSVPEYSFSYPATSPPPARQLPAASSAYRPAPPPPQTYAPNTYRRAAPPLQPSPPALAASVPPGAAPQPYHSLPASGPAYSYALPARADAIAPLPPRPAHSTAAAVAAAATAAATAAAQKPAKTVPAPTVAASGHRSVLGSGIQSSAVEEAQNRARLKAESFAKDRKRKRHEEPADPKAEKLSEEDAKLSPDALKKKRYARRLALNRESAAVSRVRRREYVKLLEEQLVNAEKERVRLAAELSDMQQQHSKLREHLQKLESRVAAASGDAQMRQPTQPTRYP